MPSANEHQSAKKLASEVPKDTETHLTMHQRTASVDFQTKTCLHIINERGGDEGWREEREEGREEGGERRVLKLASK